MSKWKKIGSVHSGDDLKSNRSFRSRSKDLQPTISFRENVARMKINSMNIVDSQNNYFCKNYIDRKKQTSSNRSLSRVKTQRSFGNYKDDIMRSTISKKKVSKDHEIQSNYSGNQKIDKSQPKKLKQNTKQSEIKAVKQDHIRLKQYVKFQINSFKAAFKDLSAELKFQINYQKSGSIQNSKHEEKTAGLVPIVPYRFQTKILENMNLQSGNQKVSHTDFNVLNQIKTQVRLCMDQLNDFQNLKAKIIQKYRDINIEQLLA